MNPFNYGTGPLYKPFGTWSHTGGKSAMIGQSDLQGTSIWRATLAEFFATLALVWITTGAIVWGAASVGMPFVFAARGGVVTGASAITAFTIGYLGIAFAFGCAYLLTTFATQHISGGYQNPAITLGLMMVGRLSILRAFLYMIAQVLGAICGAGLVKGAHYSVFNGALGGANIHNHPFSSGGTLLVEIIATAILIFVILASVDVGYNSFDYGRHIPVVSPIAVGWAYFALNLAVVAVDGGGFNPARAFGVACIINRRLVWDDQWIFWVGPVVGAIIGAIIYETIFRRSYISNFQQNANIAPDGSGMAGPGTGGLPASGLAGLSQATGPGIGGPTAV